MPKTSYRLVVLTDKVAQVFESNTCVAEFEITGEITKEDVEQIRTATYGDKNDHS